MQLSLKGMKGKKKGDLFFFSLSPIHPSCISFLYGTFNVYKCFTLFCFNLEFNWLCISFHAMFFIFKISRKGIESII